MEEVNKHPSYWSNVDLREYLLSNFIKTDKQCSALTREEMIQLVVRDEYDKE